MRHNKRLLFNRINNIGHNRIRKRGSLKLSFGNPLFLVLRNIYFFDVFNVFDAFDVFDVFDAYIFLCIYIVVDFVVVE